MWLDALVELKRKSGKTLKQISDESEVPLGTLNKLFSGQTRDPKLETVRAVVHTLGYTLDDLDDKSVNNKKASSVSSEAMKLAHDYDGLDSHGKRIVRVVTDEEMERMTADRQTRAATVKAERERTSREAAAEIKPPIPVSKDEQCLDEIALTVFQGLNPGQKQQYIDLMQGETELAKS